MSGLVAQAARVLPPDADGNDVPGFSMPGIDAAGSNFRWQQAWNTQHIAPTQATLQQIAFRADGGLEYPYPYVGTQLTNGVLRLSVEPYPPSALSMTFAQNVRGPQATVFTGTLSLPARPGTVQPTPSAWFAIPLAQPYVMRATIGTSLLMDMTGSGTGWGGPVSHVSRLPYLFDAGNTASSGGLVRYIGTSSTGVLWGFPAHLGGTIYVTACFGGAFVAVGRQRAVPAIDLGPLGAPGQLFHVIPLTIARADVARVYDGGCPWVSSFQLPVPNRAEFDGARLYLQMLNAAPDRNPLGLVVTNAVEMTVGSPPYYDSAAVFGAQASSAAHYRTDFAPVVRFGGTFQ
ncbi:MAG TPA: hypothetical protein VK081_05990 [Planctomycetota bacterium]|nr:hypothetical protein [Planctomycetota bacterium]